ncbi:hypothetical protein J7L68_06765 [bacterium]|nr:hypothetical protein [bacterium]
MLESVIDEARPRQRGTGAVLILRNFIVALMHCWHELPLEPICDCGS